MDEPSIEKMSIRAVQEKWTKCFALRATAYRSSFSRRGIPAPRATAFCAIRSRRAIPNLLALFVDERKQI